MDRFRSFAAPSVPWLLHLLGALAFPAGVARAGEAIALEKAKLVTPTGVQEGVTLLLVGGRVTAIGSEVALPAGCQRLELNGLSVWPGFIDAFAELAVERDGGAPLVARSEGAAQDYGKAAFAETAEANRRGLRPELRARTLATPPSEEALTKLRQAGFAAELVGPLDGYLPGQPCLQDLSGHPLRRSIVGEPGWLLLKFRSGGGGGGGPPGVPGNPGGPRNRMRDDGEFGYPSTLMGALAHLRQAFLDAGHLRRWRAAHQRTPDSIARPPDDECLETLERALAGELRIAFLVDREGDIRRALALAREFELKAAIIGGREAWKCAAELAAAAVPVVASLALPDAPERKGAKRKAVEAPKPKEGEPPPPPPTADESDPAVWEIADVVLAEPLELYLERRDLWKQEVGNVAALLAAGVEVALTMRGSSGPADFFADLRVAIEHGLKPEQALAALTTTPAHLFGVEQQLGSIRIGAPVSLAVVDGDLTSKDRAVRHLFLGEQHFEFTAKKPAEAEGGGRGRRRRAGAGNAEESPQEPPAGEVAVPAGLDLTGTFDLVGSGAGGFKSTLTLKQDGSALTGRLESEMGAAEITSGTLDGERFSLTVTAEFQGRKFEFKLDGTATADGLTGTFATPFGEPTAFTATRRPGAASAAIDAAPYDSHEKGCGCGAHPEDGR